jgi:hypothetical protein
MTTSSLSTRTTATNPSQDRPARPVSSTMMRAAATSLVAGSALFFAGMATSPPEQGTSKADYIASLAADPFQTQISAVFLHYGNLLMALGLLALPALVRGRRGRIATIVGALVAAVAQLDLSGALFTDWFHMEMGRQLPLEQAASISDQVLAYPMQQLCFGTGPLIVLGMLAAFGGLARAGVLGWWTVPAIVAGYAGLLFLPYDTPLLPALGTLPMLAVLVTAAVRVWGRSSIAEAR